MAGALAIARSHGPVAAPPISPLVSPRSPSACSQCWRCSGACCTCGWGRALRRYRPWARLAALGLAVINVVLFPFGTALGAYACWVLLTDEGRRSEQPADLSTPGASTPQIPASCDLAADRPFPEASTDRSAARADRQPSAAHRTESLDARFAVMAAGQREPALHAHPRVQRRERGLIEMNAADQRARRELIGGRAPQIDDERQHESGGGNEQPEFRSGRRTD